MKRTKLLSLGLAALLALSLLITPAAAVSAEDAKHSADMLHSLGLFQGVGTLPDGSPDYDLNSTPTREQAVTMLVRLLGKEADATGGSYSMPFTDVSDWAVPYVGYAYRNGLTTGTSNTTFSGSDPVSASQYLTFLLRALGYTSGTDFQWDSAWTLTNTLNITSAGDYTAATTTFTRGDVAVLSATALSARLKGTETTLLVSLNDSGVFKDCDVVMLNFNAVNCENNRMDFVLYTANGSPAQYKSYDIESVTVNGVPCKVEVQKSGKDALNANGDLDPFPATTFFYCQLSYDEAAALAAATETYAPGNGLTYPLLNFEFTGTGTFASGSVDEKDSMTLSVYIDAYGK